MSFGRAYISLVAALLVGVSGCRSGTRSEGSAGEDAGPRLAGGPGCRFDAVIAGGLDPSISCARLGRSAGFTGRLLGSSGGLKGFCRWSVPERLLESRASAATVLEAADFVPEGARLAPDCVVVQPLAPPASEDAPAESINAAQNAWAGQPEGVVRFISPAARVAVLDSAPTTSALDWVDKGDRRQHGVQVGAILAALATASSTQSTGAAYEVVSEQALRRPGQRGSLSELAEAIDRAVDAAPRPGRLILNLSLGWDPRAAGEYTEFRAHGSPAVEIVRRALQVAACRGALAVAATGSDQGFGSPSAIYPAAFTVLTRPDEKPCRTWLGSSGRIAPGDAGTPLVIAAGAVGPYEDPSSARTLSVQRGAATPTLLAFGAFPGLTGSSGAAAVVSSAVAWMWAMTPEGETATQVVRDLVRSAEPLARGPRVTIPLAATPSRQARLVRPCAVVQGCGPADCAFVQGSPLQCPSPAVSERPPSGGTEEAHVLPAVSGTTCAEAPEVTVFASEARDRKRSCAVGPDALRQPFSVTQGSVTSCRWCTGRAPPGERAVELVLDLAEEALKPAFLIFVTGRRRAIHPLGGLALQPGRRHRLRIELPGPIPQNLSARLVFEAPAGGTLTEEVLLSTSALRR